MPPHPARLALIKAPRHGSTEQTEYVTKTRPLSCQSLCQTGTVDPLFTTVVRIRTQEFILYNVPMSPERTDHGEAS